jgi:hypothetical protein
MPLQVLVGFVNVNQLVRLVDRYSNNELFEKNVRFFLGTGKEVNQRIIETITGNQSSRGCRRTTSKLARISWAPSVRPIATNA